jgi:MFS transporter, DHA1 family, inner membrane transport protein
MEKRQENFLLYTLAFVQLTHVLDFMVMMPMSPLFKEAFSITTPEFGKLVSSYNISAGIVSILSAFFVDRFDRKKVMLVAYSFFTIGTLACALAPNYHFLLLARIGTGMFGGVLSAVLMSVVGDVIPFERRAQAMGVVYMGFSVAAVIGVPAGSFAAVHTSWHVPFFVIAGMGIFVLAGIWRFVPNITAQIERAKSQNPFQNIATILNNKNRLRALLLVTMLMLGHFSIIPYMPNYIQHNVGIDKEYLPLIYLFGGLVSMFTMRAVGRISDNRGHFKTFLVLSCMALIPILWITNMPPVPLAVVLGITTLFFIFGGTRSVPANTLITSTALPHQRGSFLSLNAAIQQLASGLAAYVGGLLIVENTDGSISQYEYVGYLAAAASIVAIVVAYGVKPIQDKPAEAKVS